MPKRKKPAIGRPSITKVRKRRGQSDTFFEPKPDTLGKGARLRERHTYEIELPKKRYYYTKNGDALADFVNDVFDKLEKKYGDSIDGAGYYVGGRAALGLNENDKPDWERKEIKVFRNFMSPSRLRYDLVDRIRAYGNNDFEGLVGIPGFKSTKSQPIFFVPKNLTIHIISKPGAKLGNAPAAKARHKR